MQRSLECAVCSEVYVPGSRPPKTLPCGHSFCAPCLHNLYKGESLHCPKCRTSCSVPSSGIDNLPTSFSLLELLDFLCGECHDQARTRPCSHCSKNVCDACRETHMAASQADISADYETLKDLVGRLNDKLADDQQLQAITARRDHVIKELARIRDDQMRQVEEKFHENVDKAKEVAQEDIDGLLAYNDKIIDVVGDAKKILERIRKQNYSRSRVAQNPVKFDFKKEMKTLEQLDKEEPLARSIRVSYNEEQYKESLSESSELILEDDPLDLSGRTSESEPSASSQPICGDTSGSSKSEPEAVTSGLMSQSNVRVEPDYVNMTFKAKYESTFLRDVDNALGQHVGVKEVKRHNWGICTNPNTGDIILTYPTDKMVNILNGSLKLLRTFKTEEYSPYGVACDGHNIYISGDNNRVYVTDMQGKVVQVFGAKDSWADSFSNPRGLALDSSDNIYVCESEKNVIKVITKQGVYLRDFGLDVFHNKKPQRISVCRDKIAVTDWSGNLYLFTITGEHIRTIPVQTLPYRYSDHYFETGVVLDGNGNIVLSDVQNDDSRVVVIKETGKVRCYIGLLRGRYYDMTITPTNDLLVCSYDCVKLFSAK